MKLFTGTSGFSYKQWKGEFYPPKMKDGEMLSYYGRHFSSVEINNTFYRMPKRDLLEKWAGEVPDDFRFVLKASRRITHVGRLKNSDDSVAYLYSVAEGLGDKLGPIFVQLPPYLKKNEERLKSFLAALPHDKHIALETRDPSWETPEVRSAVEEAGHALCIVDREEDEPEEGEEPLPRTLSPIPDSGRWGYLRLRRCDYTDEDLAIFAERIRRTHWEEVFVFFKHEEDASGPGMALRFETVFNAGEPLSGEAAADATGLG